MHAYVMQAILKMDIWNGDKVQAVFPPGGKNVTHISLDAIYQSWHYIS